jgi:hypothetical protein
MLKTAIVFSSKSRCLVNAMMKHVRFGLFALLISTSLAGAQDLSVVQAGLDGSVRFLVTVRTQSGESVADLHKQDFTVFDGDVIRPIRSFRVVSAPRSQHGDHLIWTVALGMPNNTSASPVYEVIFDGARSRGPRQFHEVGIAIDRPNLEVTTSAGYLTTGY